MVQETITLEGHIIDSDVLRRIFGLIIEGGGEFEVLEFDIGRTNRESSRARLAVRCEDVHDLDEILESLRYLGAIVEVKDATFAPAEADGIVPDEFYSSTNFRSFVRIDGTWHELEEQKMDCAVVMRESRPTCVKQRLVRAGEEVLLRGSGIRVKPPERDRRASVFGFMANDVSMETNKGIVIDGIGQAMREARAAGKKVVVVPGPAIVHSGGDRALAALVREGWIDVVLSGNAFAVHDLEKAILKTSLGVCQMSGRAVEGGSRNHLYAINAVNRCGGIRPAVERGVVESGVMYELVKKDVPFVLAGSIRDDGPLRDVIVDVTEAQMAYVEALKGAGICLILASALHGIAVGNLIPASVKTVCVDMSESLPVKLSNRGTMHAVGLVTDVGFFLERLRAELVGSVES